MGCNAELLGNDIAVTNIWCQQRGPVPAGTSCADQHCQKPSRMVDRLLAQWALLMGWHGGPSWAYSCMLNCCRS